MSGLTRASANLKGAKGAQSQLLASQEFAEVIAFATVDEILAMLEYEFTHDWLVLPPWALNLSYRLACLQRPDDPVLLRQAAAALLLVGPDWDDQAEALERRAEQLENPGATSESG